MKVKTLFASALLAATALAAVAMPVDDDEEDPYFLLTEEASRAIDDGNYASAAERLREAMSLRPDAPENVLLMSNLGMVYSYMDEDSLALAVLDEALRIAPSMRTVLANRARVLLKVGRDMDAYKDLGAVIAADSVNVEARYLHGLLSIGWGDLAAAEADMTVVRDASPEAMETAVGMGALLTAQGKHREALPYLRRLVEKSGQPEDYAALAVSLLELGELSEAASTLATGIEKFPESGELYFCRARLNRDRYELENARSDARRARSLGIEPARIKTLGL